MQNGPLRASSRAKLFREHLLNRHAMCNANTDVSKLYDIESYC